MLSRDGMCRRIGHDVTGIGKNRKTEDPELLEPLAGEARCIAADGDNVRTQAVEPFKIGVQFEQVVDAGVARIAEVEHQYDGPRPRRPCKLQG